MTIGACGVVRGLLASSLLLQVVLVGGSREAPDSYTNDFAVEIDGDGTVADLVAGTHGCRIKRELGRIGNYYVFQHTHIKRRSRRSAVDILERLQKDPNVRYVEQQRLLKRVKRGIVYDKQIELPIRTYKDPSVYQRYDHHNDAISLRDFSNAKNKPRMNFKDPFYGDQWYLDNRGQTGGPPGYDTNVVPVWQKGITGKGVVVCILDDGLDHTHEDIKQNYDAKASANLNNLKDKKQDPMPNLKDPSNTHGTRCAGEVAAQANNTVCGVGIAYNAKIGGIRLLDGPVTDALEGDALTYANQHIDIYSASWGPTDNGKTMEGPGKVCKEALKTGAEKGRNGLGSIFVWATGNGGMQEDTCSCDGYVSSIYTLSIGCISDEGLSTYFTEICPSTMAVIFTGGAHHPPGMVEERNPKIKVVTTDPLTGCTLEFQGTSSAAPLAAGCFALVLEAHMKLTWRDLQHIVVQTARVPNEKEKGWVTNGGGYHVNPHFGFGALDCGRMVEVAQQWTTVPKQYACEVKPDKTKVMLTSLGSVTRELITDGCRGDQDHEVRYLEHVEVHIKMEYTYRGDVNMFLVSPQGMRSEILRPRPNDDSKKGIRFTFMTVFNWGEKPDRSWILEIHDRPRAGRVNHGDLLEWGLTLYGTRERPEQHLVPNVRPREPNVDKKAHRMNQVELKHTISSEGEMADNLAIRNGPEKVSDGSSNSIERRKDSEKDDENIEDLVNMIEKLLQEDS